MAKIKFTKMQGLGNDFVVIDCTKKKIGGIAAAAKRLCDRKFGVGADQLLLILPSKKADFRMQIYNADGSEVEMCGNGIRCIAQYLYQHRLTRKKVMAIETLAGIIRPEISGKNIKVDMGEPILEGEKIPVNLKGRIISTPFKLGKEKLEITCVSMGNPHCVIFCDDVSEFPVTKLGPIIENHRLFPKRINVEFIEVINKKEVKMRVWERGSGETLACGTGACASAVACVLNGKTEKSVTVHLAGGDLKIDWAENNHIYMTGPAVEVFQGEISL